MPPLSSTADRLKFLLEEFNLSQTELANRAGISQPTVWKIISGKSKKSRELPAIAQALGVNLSWLMNGTEPMRGAGDDLEPLDRSRVIAVYDISGITESIITSPLTKAESSWRAYVMASDSMVNVAPAGSVVIIDTQQTPGMNDYVVVLRNGKISVWRLKEGTEPGTAILQSDDPAIMPVVEPLSSVIGTVIFIVNSFRRL